MTQSEHDRRIDYIEFPVADLAESAVIAAGRRITEPIFAFAVTSWRCGRTRSPGKRSRG
jgi:hypothetical protein